MTARLTIPILRGARITLRPFTPDDAPTVQEMLAGPEIASTTLNISHPYPEGAAASWIESHAEAADLGMALTWASERTEDSMLLGAIAVHLTPRHLRGEIGYWLGVPFWNQGYTTEAAKLVVDYAFATLGLHRVQATCLPTNIGSSRVMEKAGLTFEGILRDYYQKRGVFTDVAMYARIARQDTE
ncbi:MAG TPA: GNAT family N-acetyltransferase [Thermomicrobiales bacterium]|nr:GNAT family N-acetyltransferase [Thermomicrobiales bacterium]